jgi:CheY-like chemotaxis protein
MPETILVVEDERDEREALGRLLRGRGYRVESAGNGQEALDALAAMETPPALVLLDLNMPVMDGRGLLRRMATDDALRSVPVIVTSASRVPVDADDSTAVAFLAKPLSPRTLLELVASTVARRAVVPAEPPDVVTESEPSDTQRLLAHRRQGRDTEPS